MENLSDVESKVLEKYHLNIIAGTFDYFEKAVQSYFAWGVIAGTCGTLIGNLIFRMVFK